MSLNVLIGLGLRHLHSAEQSGLFIVTEVDTDNTEISLFPLYFDFYIY